MELKGGEVRGEGVVILKIVGRKKTSEKGNEKRGHSKTPGRQKVRSKEHVNDVSENAEIKKCYNN